MPTAFTHVIAAYSLGQASAARWRQSSVFWWLAALAAILPDFDAVGLYFGIPYDSFWGHRGFLHSLPFAAVAGILLSLLVRCPADERWKPALLFASIIASHDLLDAFTSGGLGIAFFSPFDLHRYFFPVRPIKVSPIGVGFFSHRGVAVLMSEAKLVWGPALLLGLLFRAVRSSTDHAVTGADAVMSSAAAYRESKRAASAGR